MFPPEDLSYGTEIIVDAAVEAAVGAAVEAATKEEAKKTAVNMLESGKFSVEEIHRYVPKLSLEEIEMLVKE